MIRCGDDSLYTGITTDVSRRLQEHQAGPAGSKYLRGRGPLELVWHQVVGDRSLASRVESRIKKLPRQEKQAFRLSKKGLAKLIAEMADKYS